jgi:two-component system response regulator PilR (NtrC family)
MSSRDDAVVSARRGAGGRVPRVLVVDDEADIRELLELTLVRMGLNVDQAAGIVEARAMLDARSYDLCLTDMRMGDGDGLALVRHIGKLHGNVPVAVITAHGSTDNAIAALKAGAFDYLAKPVALEQLRTLVRSAINVPVPSRGGATRADARALIGKSPALAEAREMIERVARNLAPVHVTGESGSGKELAARRIHELSGRAGSFVAVNCGAIPENLMESEFFGYRKGAFTGADDDRAGFFQAASGGTLFLDEVADLPLHMQVKLLRVIQEKRVRRIGSAAEEEIDVRILSATHQNIAAMAAAGRFRQDLLYRLNVIEIRMPPLRECTEDIPMIAQAILDKLAAREGGGAVLSADAALQLAAYDFPGNVRELENVLERAHALAVGDMIEAHDLRLTPMAVEVRAAGGEGGADASVGMPLQEYLDAAERNAILAAMRESGNNRTAAARLLGVTFRSLRYRLQRLNIVD